MVTTAQTPNQNDDPMEAAAHAKFDQTRTVFGQLDTDVWFCALVAGTGKVVFDPTVYSTDQRRTSIDLTIMPLVTAPIKNPIVKKMIAESREWTSIVRPSIEKCGKELRNIKGLYAQARLVQSGRKPYIRTDEQSGEEKEITPTTFEFVAFYDTEAECQAAADALFTRHGDNQQPAPQAAPTNGVDPQRAAMAKFLPAYWVQAGKDPIKFAEKLAADPNLSRYFTIDSPEVVAIIDPLPFEPK